MSKLPNKENKLNIKKKINSSKEHRLRGPLGYKLKFEKDGKFFSCRKDIFLQKY